MPRVCEKESKAGDTLSRYPRAGTIHGAAGLAESLEARGHPSGAWRADHTLLLPYRPQDVWQGQGTDGGACVSMLILGYVKCKCKVRKRFNKGEDMFASVSHRNIHAGRPLRTVNYMNSILARVSILCMSLC